MGKYIWGLKVTTDDEYTENTAIGMYETSPVSDYPQSAGLLALYRMNAGTGSSLDDLMGNYDGTVTNATWSDGYNGFGKCLSFDGNADYVTLGHISELDGASKATFAFYVKLNDLSDVSGWIYSFNQVAPDPLEGLIITHEQTNMSVAFRNSGVATKIVFPHGLSVDTWYKIVVVYDGTQATHTDRVKMYTATMNATTATELTYNSVTGTLPATIADSSLTSAPSRLGYTTTLAPICLLDNFSIWDGIALTQTEVNTFMALGNSPSEIRLIETAPQEATTLTWNSTMLMEEAFSSIDESADLRDGGNIAQIGGLNINANDTAQLYKTLQDLPLSLMGLRAEVYEFTDTGSDPDGSRIFLGKVQEVEWDETTYNIRLTNGYIGRRSQLGTVIDKENDPLFANADDSVEGDMVPMTFGKMDKAKLKRIVSEESLLTNDSFDGISAVTPTAEKAFVVVSGSDLQYVIQIADSYTLDHIGDLQDYLEGKYLKVVISGTGGPSTGIYRKIESVDATVPASGTIQLTISDYLEADYSSLAGGETWLSLVDLTLNYRLDVWTCRSWMNAANDTEILRGFDIWAYNDGKFISLPSYSFAIPTLDTTNTSLTVEPLFIKDKQTTLLGVKILPVTSMSAVTGASGSSDWGLGSYTERLPGLWIWTGFNPNILLTDFNPDYDVSKVTNKDSSIGCDYNTTVVEISGAPGPIRYLRIIEFGLPVPPSEFDFDSVHIGVNMRTLTEIVSPSGSHSSDANIRILYRRFVGGSTISSISTNAGDMASAAGPANKRTGLFSSIPDLWYTTNPTPELNRYFFQSEDDYNIDVARQSRFTGYENYELDSITTKDQYLSLRKIALRLYRNVSNISEMNDTSTLYEMNVIFVKEYDIEDAIYSNIRGRRYQDTWGGRKTSTDLMSNPVDIIEHVNRLQNWSEVEGPPDDGWGKEYATSPMINTDTSGGGFDDAMLDFAKGLNCASQITEETDSWSDAIKKKICQEFFLASFINKDGEECISYLPYKNSVGLDTITLGDIVGEVGRMIEPRPEDIYAEPKVNYKRNSANGKYDAFLQVINSGMDEYDSSYIKGFDPLVTSPAEQEAIWDSCHDLWNLCHQVEEPPSALTDLKWIRTEYEARIYLETWIMWMKVRRCTFSVPYETGRDWYITKRIGVQLPHQTDNDVIECIIEELSRDHNTGLVTVKVIFLDQLPAYDYRVQDTYGTGSLDEWVDSYRTKAEEPTNDEDVEDTL